MNIVNSGSQRARRQGSAEAKWARRLYRFIPLIFWSRSRSEPLDQTGIHQQAVEAAGLGAAGAEVEQAAATVENLLLLRKRGVERHPAPSSTTSGR